MIILLLKTGVLLDAILMADPGAENPLTHAYREYFSKWIENNGGPKITVVKKVRADGRIHTLEEDCLEKGMLPSIAYGYKSCSQKFKIQPQDKWCNNFQPAKRTWKHGKKVIKYIGFDAGEPHRAKIMQDSKYEYRHPLIEFGLDRKACIKLIADSGLCVPPKSSCFFCPNMKKGEILSLPTELQTRAVALERNAKNNLTAISGLGRSYKWEDLINADQSQLKLFEDIEMYTSPCECTY